jgi:beta-galactosidase
VRTQFNTRNVRYINCVSNIAGGIYRHVWVTIVSTPGAYLAPWGVYAPAQVKGTITWTEGAPFADSQVLPSVEIWNNASSAQAFSLTLTVFDPVGNTAGETSGTGSVPAGGAIIWSPAQPIALANAALWYLVDAPLKPALYTAQTVLSIGGSAVDSVNITFGVRDIRYDSATGFYLNGVATKILGNANHQDFAGLGVAIPDALQVHRISKLKEFGANGWRTAHNPPNPGLLDAADALGFLVWDENHRNGQDSEIPLLVKRDRNHPSVVIWSLCNEVLCETSNTVGDALRLKALIKTLDPLGGRPVSANYNPFIGNSTPLDVQGFDYSTTNYDAWHAASPQIPSISSETSSAVSDRGEYANDPVGGHVSGYDNNYPGWGEPAEGAWGGVGEPNNQGILTRPFISAYTTQRELITMRYS